MRVQEAQVASWFESPLGQALAAAQSDFIQQLLQSRLYFRSAQVDAGGYQPFWRAARTGCGVMVSQRPHRAMCPAVLSHYDELPFYSDSLDLIILAHALDFASDPYAALREATRCLNGSGTIVVVGFNPGVWRLARWYTPTRSVFKSARFLPPRRVVDWLTLLNFELECSEVLFPAWPGLQYGGWGDKTMGLLGRVSPLCHASYVIVARKQSGAAISQGLASKRFRPSIVTPSLTRNIGNT